MHTNSEQKQKWQAYYGSLDIFGKAKLSREDYRKEMDMVIAEITQYYTSASTFEYTPYNNDVINSIPSHRDLT